MPSLVEQVDEWLEAQEGEHFEFKEARRTFSFDKLTQYCCALANEGGGKIILGVTDRRPRSVVGTRAFLQPEDTRRSLMQRIPLRIQVQEIQHPQGRVLAFDVPARPVGVPVKWGGIYWSREADSLVPMSEDRLRAVFAESGHDFSSDICPAAEFRHLDEQAIDEFHRRWIEKSKNDQLATVSHSQLLQDAELLVDGSITYAALILFGTQAALGRFLGQSEVVFEYRATEASGPAQQRREYRRGFFSFYDDLWKLIELRNETQHYQDGLFVFDVPTFDERSVREALLNAVSHRDYQLGGSVFVRQYARRVIIESPGGFPVGITVDNVLDHQSPRNRRIAESLAKCGLVERSGQGMNLMFERSIRHGKARPDFTGTDAYHVSLTLHGEVQDPRFVQFLEKVGRETQASFGTYDFLVMDLVHRELPIPPELTGHLRRLTDLGAIERLGRGRGVRYLLSRRFYALAGRRGTYTRRRGLDDETNKELLLRHLQANPSGSSLAVLHQVLPHLSPRKVQALLQELRREGRANLKGLRRWARWYAAKTGETS
ncbi:MAG: putative DNA binding domain-containing protein [Candidatus Eisenbacteria sp.]|nr:putative DNA binding domain-containing protein [Candidatus Eisenbacteria bacterium]